MSRPQRFLAVYEAQVLVGISYHLRITMALKLHKINILTHLYHCFTYFSDQEMEFALRTGHCTNLVQFTHMSDTPLTMRTLL